MSADASEGLKTKKYNQRKRSNTDLQLKRRKSKPGESSTLNISGKINLFLFVGME